MKTGVIPGQKQSDKRNSVGVSNLLCANWLKNCVCKVTFLLSSYSVQRTGIGRGRRESDGDRSPQDRAQRQDQEHRKSRLQERLQGRIRQAMDLKRIRHVT